MIIIPNKMSIRKIVFIALIFVSAVLRFWQLGVVPYGVTNDEASYIYSAYTAWKTGGHDLNGNFFPLSINIVSDLSPVPVYLSAPIVGILGVSPFSGRLPFAILGVLTVVLVFLIAKKLFSEDIALLSAFVMSVSPWHLLLSRSAYDGVVALFFILIALYILLIKIKNGNINWALIPLALAFYSYHGTKIFVILMPFLVLFFFRHEVAARRKELIGFLVGFFVILFSFIIVTKTQGVIRQSVFIWNDPGTVQRVTREIDFQRQKSTAPFVLRQVYYNKPLALSKIFVDYYLHAFSSDILFTHGDIFYLNAYGIFFKGSFYLIELPLLLLGFAYLLQLQKRKSAYLIFGLLVLAPIPSAIASGQSYLIRSIMMLPLFSLTIGCGLYYLFIKVSQYNKQVLIGVGSLGVLLYGFFISEFLYQYYFQFEPFAREQWFGSNRQVSELISNRKYTNDKIYVVAREKAMILQYAIVTNTGPEKVLPVWRNSEGNIDNIFFTSKCLFDRSNPYSSLKQREVLIAPHDCYVDNKYATTIVDPIEEQRVVWKIYEKK